MDDFMIYDDDYPTCARTHATVRIYPPEVIDPREITRRLGIEPSSWQRKGDHSPEGKPPRIYKTHGWFLTSKGIVGSKDSRRHLDWLLEQIGPKAEALRELHREGCRMDVSCFWESQSGQGGPTVSPRQMEQLARLNLDLWFDLY
ncbi:MAG: DUF4279 domain-containing protein [Planctomycetes bacterium]|nr:DUF4279 domain-containing protein [Planctomycetota bacterium]